MVRTSHQETPEIGLFRATHRRNVITILTISSACFKHTENHLTL